VVVVPGPELFLAEDAMKPSDVRFISSDSEDEQVTRWYTVDDELFGVVTDQNDRGVRLVDADSTPLASLTPDLWIDHARFCSSARYNAIAWAIREFRST
jgi:hypothetical protein